MPESGISHHELERWLRQDGDLQNAAELAIEPLAGDVSLRRYYRVRGGDDRAILAYYPPELRSVARRFERTTELLTRARVRVPAIRRIDHAAGLMLLEDVGAETLFDRRERGWRALAPYVEAAYEATLRLRAIDRGALALGGLAGSALTPAAPAAGSPADDLLAPLDAAALERELAMTWDVYLAPAGLVGEDAVSRRLRDALAAMCAELERDGLVPCHRDLMARNLVPLPDGGVVVLDHQDLRLGPAAYDVASLFNDSLYPAAAEIAAIVGDSLQHSAGYHRAVAQRALKIVGTFASFAQRGHPRHLPLVPLSLRRALEHLAALPESAGLVADLEQRWAKVLC